MVATTHAAEQQIATSASGGGVADAGAPTYALGTQRYRAGAFAEAEAIFLQLNDASPDDAAVLQMLGLCRMRLGDAVAALALLTRARALAPDDAYAQLHYGMGLHAVGRVTEAAEQFRLCQQLLPSDPAPFLNLATVLLDLGDPVAALDAAKRARRRAMNLPQAHYTVGLALLACGRLEDAIQAFADTLRFDPGFADAWVNLGVIRYRRNDIEGAKQAMRQALQIQPGHRGAAANLAAFLRLTGDVESGEALLSETLARDPAADEVRVNQAANLLMEERSGEALAMLVERPVSTEPRPAAHWRLQRSLALLQLGRAGEARAELDALGEVPVPLAPLLLWRRALLAVAEGDTAAARDHAEGMEHAVDGSTDLLPEHRIMAHYDLARFWSIQGERDRAFTHWIEGHRLLRQFQPFSRDAHRRFVDATVARFDHGRLHDGPRAADRDPAPVFIVGMPRSGTTLAEQIIGAHPQAFAAGERMALHQTFRTLGGGETEAAVARIAGLDAASLDSAAADYLRELHALAPDATRIVDKLPGNFLYLGLVALMLPGARIIHCVRDPRDIGLSIFTFRFYGHHPYAHDLGDLGWYIAEHHRLMAHWRAVLPNPMPRLHRETSASNSAQPFNIVMPGEGPVSTTLPGPATQNVDTAGQSHLTVASGTAPVVIPAKAGIQASQRSKSALDSRLRRNDEMDDWPGSPNAIPLLDTVPSPGMTRRGQPIAPDGSAISQRLLTLPLQDWVADFPATLRRVLDFLELPYDPACERFHEQDTRVRTVSRAQVRQPVNARGLGRWRGYARHLQPLIDALVEGGVLPDGDPESVSGE